ncbi:MAG: phosphoribosylglycinamide formyltransferase [Bacteroidota bacterium]
MKSICIFASGTGTNAGNMIRHFQYSPLAKVVLVVCNNEKAGVVTIARGLSVKTVIVNNDELVNEGILTGMMKNHGIDFIVLAGFLRKIPGDFIRAYNGKIINIHPALLPKFGGKGMYGLKVHEAVLAAGEKETGISIHYVTEQYDEGKIIFQAKCAVEKDDTPQTLEKKVHELEYRYFPVETEKIIAAYES